MSSSAAVLSSWTRGGALLALLLGLLPPAAFGRPGEQGRADKNAAEGLVRVTIITETQGSPEHFIFDGSLISNYRPTIYRFYPSTGVVLDQKGNVLSFLGYRWVDLQGTSPRVMVATVRGEKHPAKLVGIDQSLGVAVVRSEDAGLPKTQVCSQCEIRPDDIVFVPTFEKAGPAEFFPARVVEVGQGGRWPAGIARLNLSRPLQGVGEPLLNKANQVLGFIVNNELFYPISQLLTSAEKVIRAGGDIQTGWLGVYVEVEDPGPGDKSGVRVKDIEAGSPAEKAGLLPGDLLWKWNGREIADARNFIRAVQDTPIGSQVSLQVRRQDRPVSLTALIEARKPQRVQEKFVFSFPELPGPPGARPNDGSPAADPLAAWGVDTLALTPQLAEVFQIPAQQGLLVYNLDLQKAFDQAGVQIGDVILQVEGRPVNDPGAFYSFMQARGPGARFSLKILRKGTERVTTVQLPAGKPN